MQMQGLQECHHVKGECGVTQQVQGSTSSFCGVWASVRREMQGEKSLGKQAGPSVS